MPGEPTINSPRLTRRLRSVLSAQLRQVRRPAAAEGPDDAPDVVSKSQTARPIYEVVGSELEADPALVELVFNRCILLMLDAAQSQGKCTVRGVGALVKDGDQIIIRRVRSQKAKTARG